MLIIFCRSVYPRRIPLRFLRGLCLRGLPDQGLGPLQAEARCPGGPLQGSAEQWSGPTLPVYGPFLRPVKRRALNYSFGCLELFITTLQGD